jgi:hypothetical protein
MPRIVPITAIDLGTDKCVTITQVIMSPDETQLEVQLARLEVLLSNFQTGGAQLSGTWIADVRFERPVLKPM